MRCAKSSPFKMRLINVLGVTILVYDVLYRILQKERRTKSERKRTEKKKRVDTLPRSLSVLSTLYWPTSLTALFCFERSSVLYSLLLLVLILLSITSALSETENYISPTNWETFFSFVAFKGSSVYFSLCFKKE